MARARALALALALVAVAALVAPGALAQTAKYQVYSRFYSNNTCGGRADFYNLLLAPPTCNNVTCRAISTYFGSIACVNQPAQAILPDTYVGNFLYNGSTCTTSLFNSAQVYRVGACIEDEFGPDMAKFVTFSCAGGTPMRRTCDDNMCSTNCVTAMLANSCNTTASGAASTAYVCYSGTNDLSAQQNELPTGTPTSTPTPTPTTTRPTPTRPTGTAPVVPTGGAAGGAVPASIAALVFAALVLAVWQ